MRVHDRIPTRLLAPGQEEAEGPLARAVAAALAPAVLGTLLEMLSVEAGSALTLLAVYTATALFGTALLVRGAGALLLTLLALNSLSRASSRIHGMNAVLLRNTNRLRVVIYLVGAVIAAAGLYRRAPAAPVHADCLLAREASAAPAAVDATLDRSPASR